jgi:hypothetical protein
MVNETIARIEERIKTNENLAAEKKQELLSLVSALKDEVQSLAPTHGDEAKSIAGFAETSVHEAIRGQPDPELLRHSLDGLTLSVRRFEVSHPSLVGLINNIGQTLWKIGI